MTREQAVEYMRAFRAAKLERAAGLRAAARQWRAMAANAPAALKRETCEQFARHTDNTAERCERDAEAMGALLDG
jgi:hypothetical protein